MTFPKLQFNNPNLFQEIHQYLLTIGDYAPTDSGDPIAILCPAHLDARALIFAFDLWQQEQPDTDSDELVHEIRTTLTRCAQGHWYVTFWLEVPPLSKNAAALMEAALDAAIAAAEAAKKNKGTGA